MALITLQNLGIRMSGKWALWDVSLEIASGEITGALGLSGSGKTCLARVLAGLDTPSKGQIRFGEAGDSPNLIVSAALSTPAAAGELTVFENLEMFASLWGAPRRRRAKEISFLLELLGLADSRACRVNTLSAGAKARMEIARALVADTPVIVIDSLLDSLDRTALERLWDYFLKIRREQGKCIIVFTARGRIAEMCGRIAVLHRGRLVFIGRPEDFRHAAGEDMIVLGDISNPLVKSKISEKMSMVIKEEDGFLSFKVTNGERAVTDLLAEFGSELSCVYLKRPTLEDALDVISKEHGAYSVEARQGGSE
ncbi:MAG: ABC transporter ATP-binding protein [Armatimonadetes bacterium]|nr:ABC transporter ATP-binding protein [Armatimonadota bacterium]